MAGILFLKKCSRRTYVGLIIILPLSVFAVKHLFLNASEE